MRTTAAVASTPPRPLDCTNKFHRHTHTHCSRSSPGDFHGAYYCALYSRVPFIYHISVLSISKYTQPRRRRHTTNIISTRPSFHTHAAASHSFSSRRSTHVFTSHFAHRMWKFHPKPAGERTESPSPLYVPCVILCMCYVRKNRRAHARVSRKHSTQKKRTARTKLQTRARNEQHRPTIERRLIPRTGKCASVSDSTNCARCADVVSSRRRVRRRRDAGIFARAPHGIAKSQSFAETPAGQTTGESVRIRAANGDKQSKIRSSCQTSPISCTQCHNIGEIRRFASAGCLDSVCVREIKLDKTGKNQAQLIWLPISGSMGLAAMAEGVFQQVLKALLRVVFESTNVLHLHNLR